MQYERVATFAERLKHALLIKGMKQCELCRLTNIPKSALSQYLSGAFEPRQERIYLLAKALNVKEAWLMGLDTPMERKKEAPTELTEGEMMLLELFRQVPAEQQNLVLDMIRVALGKKE